MNYRIPGFVLTATASAVHANAWEDNFQRWVAPETYIAASKDPEIVPSAGGAEQDLERMWRQGYVAVGYSSFNSKNSKTRDAERFAKEIGARYLIVGTALKSSRSGALPIQSPTSTTTFTHGNAQVNGTGGYASGTFNGTSTTFGSQTTMLPFTINTFSKFAVYFAEVPRKGAGLFLRPVNNEEMLALETRHALVVRWVRDGSPGYTAEIFPGDIILSVNGRPADATVWQEEQAKSPELQLELLRKGSKREIAVVIPPEWR